MISNSEISNLAQSMVYSLDGYLTPKEDSKLYTVTKLHECNYSVEDLFNFINEFKEKEDLDINIKYFDNNNLTIYDIAKNILLEKIDEY